MGRKSKSPRLLYSKKKRMNKIRGKFRESTASKKYVPKKSLKKPVILKKTVKVTRNSFIKRMREMARGGLND
ncbi:MAG: hypothetical protein Q8Q42_01750 [Nanoarchaeota archaeon]|nr:hypothetical protein [Nanoarchaeota archaeon]